MNEGIKMKLKSYSVIKKRFLLALIFFLFAFTLTAGVYSKRVNAVTIDGCDSSAADGSFGFSKCLFGKVVDALPELDIRRTIQNTLVSMVVDVPMQMLTEHTWDEVIACVTADFKELKNRPGDFYKREGGPRSAVIGINHGDPDGGGPLTSANCEFGLLDKQARGSGSFMAMVSTAGYAVQQKDVMPVNLALFFRDEVKNVPFIGNRVYAATYDNLPFEDLVLGLWKLARNMAYAILSVIMIIVGVMIMVRKKVNPQLVVTIENAIPRVILGIFLITFSYPIGATIISLIEPFKRLGDGILNSMAASLNPVGALGAGAIAVLVWLMLMSVIAAIISGGAGLPVIVGVGAGAGIVMIIVFVIYLVVCAIAFFKTLLIMIRMIMATITAPFTFAIGTIPGKEEVVTNWFKLMFARALSVFAMYTTLALSGLVLHYLIANPFSGGGIWDLGNLLIMWVMTPFIIIVILGTAIGMPKKVEEMFMGPPKRR